ncbi:hypothetical protein [Enterococcus faecalis]|uniref:hypothetical protein n=1 Tax=Enterococcus faecalis TaxID=1351 RepID=UPI001BB47221|nr:hypothetical protein [Enterococcus faecalis]CAG4707005.1 Uncharacterised protein [Enterococcus faecalis]
MQEIEIGKIYYCEVPSLEGSFEVQVLQMLKDNCVLVRVVRCTLMQSKYLKKNKYRFIVNMGYMEHRNENAR